MKIFETHAHYDDEAFDNDRYELIESMLGDAGSLDYIVNVGASICGCKASVELAQRFEKVYAAVGIHPEEVYELNESDITWMKSVIQTDSKIVAVGEIGLDYHYISEDKTEAEGQKQCQYQWFERQMNMAYELKKPVIIHSREACQDTINVLRNNHGSDLGGIIHCYSYTKEAAKDFLNMGFYIGIGGVITFKNARKLVEAVEYIPTDRLVLETDAPYMAPEPFRGKRNDSRYIEYVAERIADIKKMTSREVIDITNRNAQKLFFE